MKEKRRMKPLQELDLLDRFLFDNVMEDPEICRDILSICLGGDIPDIVVSQKEKQLELSSILRGIRMDVFSIDTEDTVYNAEMQKTDTKNLCKRSRYYQAHLDVSLLDAGEINFNQLNDTYLVMIMPFDLFGEGRYRYTFEYLCRENTEIKLADGATKIFLNTKGTVREGVSQELIDFLQYVENSSRIPEAAKSNERLKRIHNKVHQIKRNEEMGVRYMQDWEEKVMIKEEGRAEGLAKGKEEGRAEGRAEGIIAIIRRKRDKGMDAAAISDLLELEDGYVQKVIELLEEKENRTDVQVAELLLR